MRIFINLKMLVQNTEDISMNFEQDTLIALYTQKVHFVIIVNDRCGFRCGFRYNFHIYKINKILMS